jgi:hypothetical protein
VLADLLFHRFHHSGVLGSLVAPLATVPSRGSAVVSLHRQAQNKGSGGEGRRGGGRKGREDFRNKDDEQRLTVCLEWLGIFYGSGPNWCPRGQVVNNISVASLSSGGNGKAAIV